MTRINTNVASLYAQNGLAASNRSLNTSLQRLSTGLKINTGADDPAGLIASEGSRAKSRASRRRSTTPSKPTTSSPRPTEPWARYRRSCRQSPAWWIRRPTPAP